jgi:hypothetical protein
MSNAISRRELLKWASAGAGAAAVGIGTYAIGRGDAPTPAGVLAEPGPASDSTTARRPENTAAAPPASPSTTPAATDLSQRLLVVVEMAGGNDGMSMVVPYGDGTYYDLRQSTAIGESDVLAIDDEVGFHPRSPSLHQRGAAIVQGVGRSTSDGSHFEMLARWWAGALTERHRSFTPASSAASPTRSAIRVHRRSRCRSAPVHHPGDPVAEKVSTLAIPGADAAGYLAGCGRRRPVPVRLFQQTVAAFGSATPFGDLDARLRRAWTAQSLASRACSLGVDRRRGGHRPRLSGQRPRQRACDSPHSCSPADRACASCTCRCTRTSTPTTITTVATPG